MLGLDRSNLIVMPTIPATLTGTVLSATSIRVQWTDVSGETSFSLSRAPVSSTGVMGAFEPVATLAPNTLLFNNTGLAAGRYQYRVRACNLAGCSVSQDERHHHPAVIAHG